MINIEHMRKSTGFIIILLLFFLSSSLSGLELNEGNETLANRIFSVPFSDSLHWDDSTFCVCEGRDETEGRYRIQYPTTVILPRQLTGDRVSIFISDNFSLHPIAPLLTYSNSLRGPPCQDS